MRAACVSDATMSPTAKKISRCQSLLLSMRHGCNYSTRFATCCSTRWIIGRVQCAERLLILPRGEIILKIAFFTVKYVCLQRYFSSKRFLVMAQIFHVKQQNLFRKFKQSDEEKWEMKNRKGWKCWYFICLDFALRLLCMCNVIEAVDIWFEMSEKLFNNRKKYGFKICWKTNCHYFNKYEKMI